MSTLYWVVPRPIPNLSTATCLAIIGRLAQPSLNSQGFTATVSQLYNEFVKMFILASTTKAIRSSGAPSDRRLPARDRTWDLVATNRSWYRQNFRVVKNFHLFGAIRLLKYILLIMEQIA